jgi:2'-hydroxyisoflavone reductase
MRILVLGGTRFVGRHIVEAALAAGHAVDIFSRGRSAPPAGVGALIGDRDGDLSALDGDWDVVVDVSAYVPRQVRATAERLSGRAKRYLFVSTASVYRDFARPETREDAPLKELDDPTIEEVTAETYGGLKVACERVAEEAFDGPVLALRPTYVVGPEDYTDRFTSWLRRVRRGGRVAAPEEADLPVAFIDARDLGRFTALMVESDATGAVNLSGPGDAATWGGVLDAARRMTDSDARFVWLPRSFVEAHAAVGDVFPMAAPFTFRDARPLSLERAGSLGLTHTPLDATIRDTLAWFDAFGEAVAGPSEAEEHALLALWDAEPA